MGKHANLTGAQRVARRRAALRAQGLRPKQFWLPDPRDPKVKADIDRAVAAINASEEEASITAFVDAANNELMATLPPYDWGDQPPATDGSKPA